MSDGVRPAVLVIDGDRDIVKLMECVLAGQGYDAVTCGTPEEGLQILNRQPIGCVLIDIHFARTPESLGFLRALRMLPQGNRVPVLATSAMAGQEVARQVMELGARKLIQKPFFPRDILQEIRAAFA